LKGGDGDPGLRSWLLAGPVGKSVQTPIVTGKALRAGGGQTKKIGYEKQNKTRKKAENEGTINGFVAEQSDFLPRRAWGTQHRNAQGTRGGGTLKIGDAGGSEGDGPL